MKVAFCSHFGGFQSSYALHVGHHERARLLERFGVNFDFLVNEKCKADIYPNQKNCLPNPSTKLPFADRAMIFEKAYLDLLKEYDVVITADMVYQTKGNFLAENAAQRKVANSLKTWWCHWIHSGWTDRPPHMPYPENLKYEMPPRSFLVYLNSWELPDLARMYNAEPKYCHCVYNPKDIRSFHEMDDIVWRITDILDIPNKDIITIFPFCTTRMDAKGIDGVIQALAAFKRKGNDIALILANANANKRTSEIKAMKGRMNKLGLIEGEDYIWTSDINNGKPLPRKSIADLYKLSNLFVFLSWRETVGNVFQEALVSGCHLILNANLPCLREMGNLGRNKATFVNTSFKTPGIRDGVPGDFQMVNYNPSIESYFDEIAEYVLREDLIPPRYHQWAFSLDKIWNEQMEPLLRKAYLAGNGKDFLEVIPLASDQRRKPVKAPTKWSMYAQNIQLGKDMTGAPLIPPGCIR